MARRLNAVVYGVGAMGRLLVPMLLDKGVTIVGAVTRSSHLGEDLGEVCGRPALGVAVTDDPDEALAGDVDVAILSVATYLADMEEHIARCVARGANVVTTSEEALFPWGTDRARAQPLDELARQHGVTVLGSGFQDFYWIAQAVQLAGTCHRIDHVHGVSRFNADDYGPELAKDHYVGLSPLGFAAVTVRAAPPPSFMKMAAPLIARGLGLEVTSLEEKLSPTTASTDLTSTALGLPVPAGHVTGKAYEVHAETTEGPTLRLELIGRLYEAGETDLNSWRIEGAPSVSIDNPAPATDTITCATIVNRIPDVIAAAPGFLTPLDLPPLRYRAKPLASYLA